MAFYTYHYDVMTHIVSVTFTNDAQETNAPKRVGAAPNRTQAAHVAKLHAEKIAKARANLGHTPADVFYP